MVTGAAGEDRREAGGVVSPFEGSFFMWERRKMKEIVEGIIIKLNGVIV